MRETKSTSSSLLELVMIVAVALGLALGIQAFLVKPYRIPSESMVPTLEVGQRVLVNRIGHVFSAPSVGDIVVFHPPVGAEEGNSCGVTPPRSKAGPAACPRPVPKEANVNFIKRVVAGPGDRLKIIDGHVWLNGKKQNEPYIKPCEPSDECNYPTEITIPAGYYFMMGDNRGSSDDSRFWGPVPNSWIIGGAFATYWPPSRIGIF